MKHPLAINLKFILKAHILNPLWLPRDRRRNIRCVECYRRVEALLDKYRHFVRRLDLQGGASPKEEAGDGNENKKADAPIFSIWFQGEENAPKLVKVCFDRLRTLYGSRFRVLDEEALLQLISLPEPIMRKWRDGTITAAHFSDICRIELLYRYGGMWFDATDFITEPVPRWIEEADFFIYTCGDIITPQKLIQSCYIRGSKGHPLLGALREFLYEYWAHEGKLIDYFLLHYMFRFLVENNEEAARLFYEMPQIPQDPTHVLWHKNRDRIYSDSLYLKSTEGTFFQKTTFKCRSAREPKPDSVADYILNEKIPIPYGKARLSDSRP